MVARLLIRQHQPLARLSLPQMLSPFADGKNEAYSLPGVPHLPPDQIPVCDNQAVPPAYITCTLQRK